LTQTNAYGQPVGDPVPGWTLRPLPQRVTLHGRFARLEKLDPARHAAELWCSNRTLPDGRNFTYLPIEPFASEADYTAWLTGFTALPDPLVYAIVDQATGRAVGIASYLRIDPANGCIEVGHLNFSPLLQRKPAATEAMYLMLRHAFDDLGYRRYEWKCDALNAPSRAAALRLGFTFEGIFRQAVVTKGRNRDTAWYAIIDQDWPALRARFEQWLQPGNFRADGQQINRL